MATGMDPKTMSEEEKAAVLSMMKNEMDYKFGLLYRCVSIGRKKQSRQRKDFFIVFKSLISFLDHIHIRTQSESGY